MIRLSIGMTDIDESKQVQAEPRAPRVIFFGR